MEPSRSMEESKQPSDIDNHLTLIATDGSQLEQSTENVTPRRSPPHWSTGEPAAPVLQAGGSANYDIEGDNESDVTHESVDVNDDGIDQVELHVGEESEAETDITASITSLSTPPGSPLWNHRNRNRMLNELQFAAECGLAPPAWSTPQAPPRKRTAEVLSQDRTGEPAAPVRVAGFDASSSSSGQQTPSSVSGAAQASTAEVLSVALTAQGPLVNPYSVIFPMDFVDENEKEHVTATSKFPKNK